MRLVIPGVPPSVNHMYERKRRKGRLMDVLTEEAEAWIKSVNTLAKITANRSGWICRPKGKKVVVRLWYFWPDRRRRDTHNTHKAMMDAFEGAFYEDDKDALPRVMDYQIDRKNPRVEVEICDIEEASA